MIAIIKLINFTLVYRIIEFALKASNQKANSTILIQMRDYCFSLKMNMREKLKAAIKSF